MNPKNFLGCLRERSVDSHGHSGFPPTEACLEKLSGSLWCLWGLRKIKSLYSVDLLDMATVMAFRVLALLAGCVLFSPVGGEKGHRPFKVSCR